MASKFNLKGYLKSSRKSTMDRMQNTVSSLVKDLKSLTAFTESRQKEMETKTLSGEESSVDVQQFATIYDRIIDDLEGFDRHIQYTNMEKELGELKKFAFALEILDSEENEEL